jgi:putative ABC transport system ATP-binding protein
MLEVRRVAKRFDPAVPLLEDIGLTAARGEWVAIVGESGSGKSTLLNLIAGLDRPDRGEVRVDASALHFDDDDALALWRRRHVGFVFQAFHLLPYLSVAENVALPLALLEIRASERRTRAEAALAAVGLGGFGDRKPGTLSGGEMQRAAIARALVHEPVLLLADEPTGNLDEGNAAGVLECLRDAVRRANACALMVTHSHRAAASADRVLQLAGGRLSAVNA